MFSTQPLPILKRINAINASKVQRHDVIQLCRQRRALRHFDKAVDAQRETLEVCPANVLQGSATNAPVIAPCRQRMRCAFGQSWLQGSDLRHALNRSTRDGGLSRAQWMWCCLSSLRPIHQASCAFQVKCSGLFCPAVKAFAVLAVACARTQPAKATPRLLLPIL
jgi:hypothetical protein